MSDEIEQTQELLKKLVMPPIGEERLIKLDFCGDMFTFKIRMLSSKDLAKIRRVGASIVTKPGEEIDPLDVVDLNINTFLEKTVIEPKLPDLDTLNDIFKDILVEEILKAHGYSDDILEELEKKSRKSASGTNSRTTSKSRK